MESDWVFFKTANCFENSPVFGVKYIWITIFKLILPGKVIQLKFLGFLKYIAASKHENVGRFLQVSIVFHPRHSETLLTKIDSKVFVFFSIDVKRVLTGPEFHSIDVTLLLISYCIISHLTLIVGIHWTVWVTRATDFTLPQLAPCATLSVAWIALASVASEGVSACVLTGACQTFVYVCKKRVPLKTVLLPWLN